jgi:hypothetical protein
MERGTKTGGGRTRSPRATSGDTRAEAARENETSSGGTTARAGPDEC